MPARNQPFSLFAGDDREITITVKDADEALVDLTGAAIVWRLLLSGRQITIVEKSVGHGIAISNQTTHQGQCVVSLQSADTLYVDPAVLYHEADVTLGGLKSTVVFGKVTLERSGV